jgi:hypothetical protein
MRSRSISATPSPWSVTSIRVRPAGWETCTRTGVPDGACLPALSTRLPTTMTGPVTAADSRAWPWRAAARASSTAAGTSPLSTYPRAPAATISRT